MRWSKYNYLFQDNTFYYIYNALSNSFAELDFEDFNLLKDLSLNFDTAIKKITNEDLESLKQAKFIADDKEELLRIKYSTHYNRFDNSFISLTINPTLDCNFNCTYCFENNNRRKEYMDDVVENNLIEFINSYTPTIKGIYLTWFGGEPLMAFDKIVSITTKIKKFNLPFGAKMITNGYLLTKEKIEQLDNLSINSIQITIDGTEINHNSRRKLLNGNGTFDKIIFNIKNLLLFSNTTIIVRVNIDENNKEDYINVCKYFTKTIEEQYYDRISIVPGFIDDINSCNTDSCLFDRDRKSKFLIEIFNQYGVFPFNFYPSDERYECPTRNINTFTIGPKGEIYKCWNDVGKQDKIIGSLGSVKHVDSNNNVLLKYLTSADPLEDENCKSCFHFPICGGGCPFERISKEFENKSNDTCDFMKDHIEDFLKIHLKLKKQKAKNEHKI